MRKTKIICTLGPATKGKDILRQLIEKGADIFRLNMSHADHRSAREIVPLIRQLAEETGRPVGVLFDTQGPAIRTGDLKTDLHLNSGDVLELTVGGAKNEEPYSVDVNYEGIIDDVSVGDTILVDNGMLKLVVLEKRRAGSAARLSPPGRSAPGVTLICPACT